MVESRAGWDIYFPVAYNHWSVAAAADGDDFHRHHDTVMIVFSDRNSETNETLVGSNYVLRRTCMQLFQSVKLRNAKENKRK